MSTPMDRRKFLTLAGGGALGALATFRIASAALAPSPGRGYVPPGIRSVPPGVKSIQFAGTDGWIAMPEGSQAFAPWFPDVLAPDPTVDTYAFGFRNVTGLTRAQVEAQRGVTQASGPLIWVEAGKELWVTLSNLGLSLRPDLVDSHTVHWHGFRNAIPFYDGVPETSISVPIGRDFTYVYKPELDAAGTYMYHCHFEDVEHVTMGMTGIVFVTPPGAPAQAYADPSTAFDRQYAIILTEIDSRAHFNDAHIQATDWTVSRPNFWLMNGRAYPDTLQPNCTQASDGTPLGPTGQPGERLAHQPNSSLIVCKPGEKVLVRLANLGFQEHSLTLPGIPMRVAGNDARFLGEHTTSTVDTVDIGPGESRDVLFTAPNREGTYPLFNRDMAKYPGNGSGDKWYGGQRTHVVVKSGIGTQPVDQPNWWDPAWL